MSALPANAHTPVNAAGGAVTMTLPTGASQGAAISVEKYDATANLVTITGNLRGVAAQSISLALPKETVTFRADSSGSWWPIAGHKTLSSLDNRNDARLSLSNNFHLKSTYNKLAAIEKGTVAQLRWCVTGTSTANMKWYEYAADLIRYAGGFAGSILVSGGSNTRSPRSSPGLSHTDTGTVTTTPSNDTSVWIGPTVTLGAGSTRSYGVGGANFTYDHAEMYYIGGTGVFSVQVGAGTPVNVDTSSIAAGTLGIYTAAVPSLAGQAFTIAQVSGTPKIIDAGLWNSTIPGVIPCGYNASGLTYNTLATQAWTNYQTFLAHVLPDMITWEAKGGQWSDGKDATQLVTMLNTIQAGAPQADVVLIGGPPDNGGAVPGGGSGVSQLDCNRLADATARNYAPALNVVAWDGYSPLGSWASVSALDAAAAAAGTATALDWAGDGVHLGWRSQAVLAELLVRDMGLHRLNRNKASADVVFAGTKLQLAKTPSSPNLSIENDTFDLDAYFYLKRMLRVRAAGSSTDFIAVYPAQTGQSYVSTDLRLGAANGPKIAPQPTYIFAGNVSGAVTFDLSSAAGGEVIIVATLVGNVTSWAFSNYGGNGQNVTVHWKQDGTGGWTLPISGSLSGGGAIRVDKSFALDPAANARTPMAFQQIGGGFYQIGGPSGHLVS